MKKILFYCQYHLGMGHLVRSVEIIRALAQEFEVCFVKAGTEVAGMELPASVKVVTLPLLLSEHKQLKVADPTQDLEEIKQLRKSLLLKTFADFQPDILMIEGYPFKKFQFEFEAIPLLDLAKSPQYKTQIVCSLRDIVMAQNYQDWAEVISKTCDRLNRYFDLLLVHSDPAFYPLEESFPDIQNITCPIVYSGYVAQALSDNPTTAAEDALSFQRSEPMLLVSVGGGQLGHDLLEASIAAAPILKDLIPHHIHLFTGPFIPEAKFLQLQQAASDQPNLTFRKYTSQLLKFMQQADLSISLGGYNTTMNILSTAVRSLLLPSNKDWEQKVRAEKLEKLGFLQLLAPEDIEPQRLSQRVVAALTEQTFVQPSARIALNGAEQTVALLHDFLDNKVPAPASNLLNHSQPPSQQPCQF
jgi:predicted glycosyltransferase